MLTVPRVRFPVTVWFAPTEITLRDAAVAWVRSLNVFAPCRVVVPVATLVKLTL